MLRFETTSKRAEGKVVSIPRLSLRMRSTQAGAELILLNFNFRIQISERGRPLSVQPPVPGQPATDIRIQKFTICIFKVKKSLLYGHVTRNIAVAQQTVTEGRNQEDKNTTTSHLPSSHVTRDKLMVKRNRPPVSVVLFEIRRWQTAHLVGLISKTELEM